MPYASNGPTEIYYETFGDPAHPALLMVNGLGSQCINYADAWCEMFAAEGLFTIRYDNRDVGLSSSFADRPPYSLSDMAGDGLAVLDALGIERAHVMGLSLGGMIVQTMAIEHPERLLSMTSVMSRTGDPGHGEPTPEALALLTAPPATDRESYVAAHIAGLREWGSPEFADEARWRADAERAYDRAFRPDGVGRQMRASRAGEPRGERLREVRVPTLVIHGDRDTLIPLSGGEHTAQVIPGARLEVIEGMGHDYPPQLWARWVRLVADFVHAVPSSTGA